MKNTKNCSVSHNEQIIFQRREKKEGDDLGASVDISTKINLLKISTIFPSYYSF